MASPTMDISGLETVEFGSDIRQKEFCLRPNSVQLNSGSYGTVPKRIRDMQNRYLDEMESHPDCWFRVTGYKRWTEARQAVADFVGADVEDIVFVVNVTTGVNTVLRSCKLSPGDAILGTSLTYGSLQNLWRDLIENVYPKGVESLLMEIKMPIVSEDSLVQQYDDYLTQHPNIKLVLLDHITSSSAILMPVRRLAEVCRKHGALVMVDGAHAPGQVPLNLTDLDVDFYTGNLHKWMYTPRGCGFLWVKREHHSKVRPLLTSWNYGKSLSEQFFDQGTRNHIPFFCALYGLQFYQGIGGMEKVVGYTSKLATEAQDLLVSELKLQRPEFPVSMQAPNLRLLKLPGVCRFPLQLDAVEELKKQIYEEDDVQLHFTCVDGVSYLRISIQVHNTIEDIQKTIPVMKRVMKDFKSIEKFA